MQPALTLRTWLNVQPDDAMPPYLKGGLPLIGHSKEFGADPVAFLSRGERAHGNLFTFNLMGTPAVAMLGPEANEAFFRAPDTVLSPKEAYRIMTPVFGKGIAYDAEPAIMDEQLAFLYPALKESSLKRYVALMTEEAEAYFDRWGDRGEIDVNDFGNELTMYTSSRSLLGAEFRSKLDSQFAELYHHLDASLTPIAYFFPNLPIPRFRKRDAARKGLVKLFGDIVDGRRQSGRTEEDLLQALIDARYKNGRALTHDEITGLILTIVFAGHHTSGALTAWMAVELLRHPGHLDRIRSEIESLHPNKGDITFQTLKKSDELERMLMETERFHPPIIIMMRKAMETFAYKHWRIPAGTMIVTSPSVSHMDGAVFSEPERFDPARFGEGRAEHKKFPYGMITFGGGKHKCIGLNFAYLQLKAIFAVMLRRFDIQLVSAPGHYVANYDFMLVGPKSPAKIAYRRRAG